MKRSILAVILVLGAVFYAQGQNSEPIDLVLLLDTSNGMSSSNTQVNDYITGAFLSEFLRVGDTFHLIVFSQRPRLEIARRISSRGDVETIIGRMLIQYPIETGTNAQAALSFAENYVAGLPARPKKIVMVGLGGSDVNNQVSAFRQRFQARDTTLDFVQVTPGQAITNAPSSGRAPRQTERPAQAQTTQPSRPSTVTTAPVTTAPPSTTTPSSTQTTTTPSATQQAATPSTTTQAPPVTATTPATTTSQAAAPQSVSETSSGVPTAQLPGSVAESTVTQQTTETTRADTVTDDSSTQATESVTVADDTALRLSQETVSGTEATPQTRETTPSQTTQASTRTQDRQQRSTGESFVSSLPLIIGLILAAILLLLLIIFLVTRRLGSSPNRVMAEVSTQKTAPAARQAQQEPPPRFKDHSKDLASYAAVQTRRTTPYADKVQPAVTKPVVIPQSGPCLLNLFVEDQNTAIGKRNIHSLKSGYSLSVGGGKSDYLIFLVPIPSNIGEVRRNGSQLSFIPKKPKYFPDLGSNELRDCLNKTIRIVSDKNYEIRFRFEMYEDPLVALNNLLLSVKVPG